ncbi:hypothetical protein PTSG_12474, partial [Salpingoeca rosetta]
MWHIGWLVSCIKHSRQHTAVDAGLDWLGLTGHRVMSPISLPPLLISTGTHTQRCVRACVYMCAAPSITPTATRCTRCACACAHMSGRCVDRRR